MNGRHPRAVPGAVATRAARAAATVDPAALRANDELRGIVAAALTRGATTSR